MNQTTQTQATANGDWRALAACRDTPSRWFTDPHDASQVREAVATCHRCPVRTACLNVAMRQPPEADVGIWGGTTEHDRRQLRAGHPLPRREPDPPTATPPVPRPTARSSTATAVPARLPAPETTVSRDDRGVYTDLTGRVAIFRIHGTPPWMVLVDDRPLTRTRTLAEGRRAAWAHLHTTPDSPDRAATARASGAQANSRCQESSPRVRTPLVRGAATTGRSR